MTKPFKTGARETRTFNFDRAATDKKARTVELSFSSEQPYGRHWGKEILDHGSKSVRLGRLRTGGPLLVDHDTRDIVGVIESVRVDADRKGRAVVRFGKSARAKEVFQDVTDGIRCNVLSPGFTRTPLLEELMSTPEGKKRWTLRLLAERMVELEIVPELSHETVRQRRALAL